VEACDEVADGLRGHVLDRGAEFFVGEEFDVVDALLAAERVEFGDGGGVVVVRVDVDDRGGLWLGRGLRR
jgi:hypothetical protein